ncbi:hypothetical protein [Pleomorphovibrio marinus]|uniref:hypothetical protein n=1 Tax=Pleomorphovibrio marinus TaxID=2164132 RepID=UPI0037431C2C
MDILIERGQQLLAIEVKSGKTIHPDFFKSLDQFKKIKPDVKGFLVYGGKESQTRSQAKVVGFHDLTSI